MKRLPQRAVTGWGLAHTLSWATECESVNVHPARPGHPTGTAAEGPDRPIAHGPSANEIQNSSQRPQHATRSIQAQGEMTVTLNPSTLVVTGALVTELDK